MQVDKPIELHIEDNFRFGQVAVILDSPKVFKKIVFLRRKWKIDKCYPRKQYILWIKKLGAQGLDKEFSLEANKLCKSLNLDFAFERVFKMAIVCNEIWDYDFKTAYWEPVFDPRDLTGQTKRYAIYLTPDTKLKEVINIYNEFVKEVSYSRTRGRHTNYKFIPNISKMPLADTKNEIRIHRMWYWLNRNGGSPRQIAMTWPDRGTIDVFSYTERVKTAINSYKKTLIG